MGGFEFFVVWFVSSWLVFFAVASIGIETQAESGTVTEGTEPSAPVRPLIVRKLIWAASGGLAISLLVMAGLYSGLFQWLYDQIDYTRI